MLITSHLLATLFVGKILNINELELVMSLVAGVAVDIDHFFVNRKWVQDIKDFLGKRIITKGVNQHSWLQEWLFGLTIFSILGLGLSHIEPQIRWWIMPLFLGIHIFLDGLMECGHWPLAPFKKFGYKGFITSGTMIEFIVSVILLLVLIFQY